MRYGLEIACLGAFADPHNVLRLAMTAETAGWDGLFIWDHLPFAWGVPSSDPWIMLAAIASSTTRMKIGSAVTPVPHMRPEALAQSLTTLDLLSGGRLIFGAGLGGSAAEYSAFAEPAQPQERAAILDEGLDLLKRLWSGEKVSHQGSHFTVQNIILSPTPRQKPRIPIWIGGENRSALRRAAQWDGWVMNVCTAEGKMNRSPQDLANKITLLRQLREQQEPFNVAVTGCSTPYQGSLALDFSAAGATWWVERLHGLRGSLSDLMQRAAAGPPHE
jgi:alkanesulfonate monooxygenase SsuD/methylene tetrahydromethanopterin reductase-like flavin-dependent oxidoreductase (luciferase family)